MIFGFLRRRDGNAAIVDRLYATVAEASRRPAFYAFLGVPDTVEGRFDCLTLHVVLVLRRLEALPAPAGDLARDLVDVTFAQFDAALRELGVSDIGVPKKMKVMAAAFFGRAKAYEAAFAAGEDALAQAIHRNLLGGAAGLESQAGSLAAYAMAAGKALESASFEDFTSGAVTFPAPDAAIGGRAHE